MYIYLYRGVQEYIIISVNGRRRKKGTYLPLLIYLTFYREAVLQVLLTEAQLWKLW